MAYTLNHTIRRTASVLDTAGLKLSDTETKGHVQAAYRHIARLLRTAGMGLLRKQTLPTVSNPVTMYDLITVQESVFEVYRYGTSGGSIFYPSDLIRPIEIRERYSAVGQTAAGSWVAMRSSDGFIPDPVTVANSPMGLWDWREDKIILRGSTANHNDIQIQYEAELPALTYGTDELLIPDGMDAIAWCAASFAAAAADKGGAAAEWMKKAEADTDLIAKSEVKVKQAQATRWGTQ